MIQLRSVFTDLLNRNLLFIKFILFGLFLQVVSLFRNYPEVHPCGKLVKVNSSLKVLINCDSAVFLKDVQFPSRLINGSSDYQDRPLPTLVVAGFNRLWEYFSLPNKYDSVLGNSGKYFTYSSSSYLLFIIFVNMLVFASAILIATKTIQLISTKYDLNRFPTIMIQTLIVSIISMNEITKTFFWTPHSQMFNILLPIYMFFLIQFISAGVSTRFYVINFIAILLLSFCYNFFLILYIFLLFIKWKNLKIRFYLSVIGMLPLILYPLILTFVGGSFKSITVGKYREYIWVLDSVTSQTLSRDLSYNLAKFYFTFPLIPSLLLITFFVIYFIKTFPVSAELLKIIKTNSLVIFLYLMMLSFMGYYSRRLTFAIIIYATLFSSNILIRNLPNFRKTQTALTFTCLYFYLFYSWFFTLGPLV